MKFGVCVRCSISNKSCTFYLSLLPPGVTAAAGHGPGDTPGSPLSPGPGTPCTHRGGSSSPSSSSSVGEKNSKRIETKNNETRGKDALTHLGRERGAPPERTRRVSAPSEESGSGGKGAWGVFFPSPHPGLTRTRRVLKPHVGVPAWVLLGSPDGAPAG